MIRILDAYVGRTVLTSVLGVMLIVVALDGVFRFLDEVGGLKNDYTFVEAVIFVLLSMPGQLYYYLPYAALIGALVGMGSLATSSELVVMQAAGRSVRRLIWSAMKPALVLVLLAQLMGEFVSPMTDQIAQSRQAMKLYGKERALRQKGVWNREGNHFMHFRVVQPNGVLHGVSVYEFDDHQQLQSTWYAEKAIYQGDYWQLEAVKQTRFHEEFTEQQQFATRRWDVGVNPQLLALLVLEPDDQSLRGLWRYAAYLGGQGQDNREYLLVFWEKCLQPLSTLALIFIAISTIFGPLRTATMGARVFIGICIGVGFRMAQNLFSPASLVFGIDPLLAVLIPILACLLIGVLLLRRVR